MTCAELIQKLQYLDGSKRVVVHGYEGGYSDVMGITTIDLKLNVHHEWYYGPHDEPEDGEAADETVYVI